MRRAGLIALVVTLSAPALAAYTNNIMLTGYWPPTNDMLRPFSTNPEQNPGGWVGENWNGLGYDVYSFFPEVAVGQKGEGDFEVDYQDTSADWWRITSEIRPVAIITFSWTPGTSGHNYKDWEIEVLNRNRTSWTNDYQAPFQPDQIPPDPTWPPNAARYSTLPMYSIMAAVNAAGVGVQAYLDNQGGGTFLSEYIGYHGLWYQSIHADPSDEAWSVAAGHIHVGAQVTTEEGWAATQVTLAKLIEHVDSIVPEPAAFLLFGVLGVLIRRR